MKELFKQTMINWVDLFNLYPLEFAILSFILCLVGVVMLVLPKKRQGDDLFPTVTLTILLSPCVYLFLLGGLISILVVILIGGTYLVLKFVVRHRELRR